LGKFNLIAGEDCLACPVGQYQDGKGQTACLDCGADTYSDELGKASKADCVACSDDKSTGASMGNTKAASCLCRKEDYYQQEDANCMDCPEGADCSAHDGITVPELVALPGAWRPDPLSVVFSPCSVGFQGTMDEKQRQAEARCCPMNSTTNVSICNNKTFAHPDEQCQEGFQGALCLVCADGWVPQGDGCVICDGGAQMYLSFLLMLGVSTGVCLVIFIILVKSVKEEKIGNAHSAVVSTIIFLQLLLLLLPSPSLATTLIGCILFFQHRDN
jgi:hypothetical protein